MAMKDKPMACAELEADLVLLHYGDGDGAERARLESHAAACAGCAAYLKELAALMPLAVKTDEPPQEFWMNYNRELRHKIDDAREQRSWRQRITAYLQPGYLTAFAGAAVVVLALTFTLGLGPKNGVREDEISDLLPVAENLEFFRAMDVLDDIELLEFMSNQSSNAA